MDDPALDVGLLLAFDSPSAEFARGFECGRLWALLRVDAQAEVTEYVHAANLEMLLRLAEATGRTVRAEDVDDTFVLATFGLGEPVDSE